MVVIPIWLSRLPIACSRIEIIIIVPSVGVQRAVSDGPDRAAAKLVGSRPRQKLNLSITPPQLGIDGRRDHSDFVEQVRIQLYSRVDQQWELMLVENSQ